MGRALVLCCALLTTAASEPPIALRVMPYVCLAPCTVRVTVTVKPHDLNRYFVVQIDGPEFHATNRPLEGANAPKTFQLPDFTGLTEGDYEITAVLYRALLHSEAGRVTTHILVTSASSP